jgi:hypothetical protein
LAIAIGGGRDSKLAAMALVASTLMSDQQNYVLQPLVVVISWSSSQPSTCFDSFISSFKKQTHTHRVSRMFQASFPHVVHEGRQQYICKKLVTIIGLAHMGARANDQ